MGALFKNYVLKRICVYLKALIALITLFCVLICFSACNSTGKIDSEETTNDEIQVQSTSVNETSTSVQSEHHQGEVAWENELNKFLEYNDMSFSDLKDSGYIEVSSGKYAVYEIIDSEASTACIYVSIKNHDIYAGFPNSEMWLVWSNGKPVTESEDIEDDSDYDEAISYYVPIYANVLDRSFNSYINETGATFFEMTSGSSLATYGVKKMNSVRYYYGTNEFVLGIKNNEICLLATIPSVITETNSPRVRDVINALGFVELFDVQPEIGNTNNLENNRRFFYWKIANGYIGFWTIGGTDPSCCYSYPTHGLVIFNDLQFINMTN